MKFLINTILLSLLLATCVSSYRFTRYGYDTVKFSNCENVTDWQNYIDKAKKEHPTAGMRDLVKFIAQDMMKDPLNPMVVLVINKESDGDYAYYGVFNGTINEFTTIYLNPFYRCKMTNHFSLLMIAKEAEKQKISKFRNKFIKNQWKNDKSEIKQFFVNQPFFAKIEKFNDGFESNCTKLPQVQAIIDKIDAMNLTDTYAWTREWIEEVKVNLKPVNAVAVKINYHDSQANAVISVISEGEGNTIDLMYCSIRPNDPLCKRCLVDYPDSGVSVGYFAK